jgi:hypothetical protein
MAFPNINYDFHKSSLISAISMGMGGNPIYSEGDAFTGYFNPSSVGLTEKENLGISYKYSPKSPESIYKSLNIVNFVQKGHLLGVAFSAPKGGFFYLPIVDRHQNFLVDSTHKFYKDFTLNSFQISISEKKNNIIFGFTGKYIYGRLVNLNQELINNNWRTESFYDDKAKGFSFDFSGIYKKGNIIGGVCFYDLLSKIYWENSSNKNIEKRVSYGVQTNTENYLFYASILQKPKFKTKKEYHFGYEKRIVSKKSILNLRTGFYSCDFKSQDDIFFTFGTSYMLKSFKIDIAIINTKWMIDNSQYIATISFGK